jgi:alpha-ribazole phosphatase
VPAVHEAPVTLWLVRHPRPDVAPGLCYGAADVPIDDAHLDELLDVLPGRLPRDADLWSSPLGRCLRLARGLERHGFGPVRTDPRLREMDFGRWEGRAWTEVPRDQIGAWRDDIVGYVPPGGESVALLAARGLAFVGGLPAGRDAILVTHAGVIQTLLRTLRGLPLHELAGQRIEYGQVLALRRDATGWTLRDA